MFTHIYIAIVVAPRLTYNNNTSLLLYFMLDNIFDGAIMFLDTQIDTHTHTNLHTHRHTH